MASEFDKYIAKRYERWLDYSKFYCSQQGMSDEAEDVLNEVLLSLLQRDRNFVMSLYNKQKKQYRELDFYILSMIKFNVTSDTAPYRHKYRKVMINENIRISSVISEIEEIEDPEYVEDDRPAKILEQVNLVREIVENLDAPETDKQIFMYRFSGGYYYEYDGEESQAVCYSRYYKVLNLIKKELRIRRFNKRFNIKKKINKKFRVRRINKKFRVRRN